MQPTRFSLTSLSLTRELAMAPPQALALKHFSAPITIAFTITVVPVVTIITVVTATAIANVVTVFNDVKPIIIYFIIAALFSHLIFILILIVSVVIAVTVVTVVSVLSVVIVVIAVSIALPDNAVR